MTTEELRELGLRYVRETTTEQLVAELDAIGSSKTVEAALEKIRARYKLEGLPSDPLAPEWFPFFEAVNDAVDAKLVGEALMNRGVL